MSDQSRNKIIVEFMQSYRLTGQLFYKLLQTAMHEKPTSNMACLPILKVLKQQGSKAQNAIARELYHSDAAISRQIRILVEDGLVSATPSENNRRTTIVELTDEGKKLLEKQEATVTDFMTDILSEMPDEELIQLIDSNSKLQTIITSKIGKESRV